jgi:pimeloyl-ACP methyl ester carboxylesterase
LTSTGRTLLHFRDTAPGADPHRRTLLLIHGFGASGFTWRNWEGALARFGRIVNVDLVGFGDSPAPEDWEYTPAAQAREVVALVRELGLEDVVIMGHSLGGGVALLTSLGLQAEGNSPITGQILVAGMAYLQRLPRFVGYASSNRLAQVLFDVIPKRKIIELALISAQAPGTPILEEQLEGYARPFFRREVRRATIRAATRLIPADMDSVVARYPTLSVPTLLLWGALDPVIPLWVGERLSRELPQARLEVLEGCGHLPQDERPKASLARVLAFLEEISSAG